MAPCYVQVNIAGDELFWVDKEILSSFSGRINRLSSLHPQVIILNGLPGGSEAFELIARLCYSPNKGKSDIITPATTCLLHYAAQFMDMDVGMGTKQIQMMKYWTWSELLVASQQCQSFCRKEEDGDDGDDTMFDKVMDSVVSRIASTSEINPSNSSYSSSPESSGVRYSFDSRSNASNKNNSSFSCCLSSSSSSSSSNCQRAWWFEDLMFLRPDVLKKMVIKMKKLPHLDHATICRFLLYYLKNKSCPSSGTEEKRIILEAVIDLLYSLDRTTISCRTLFAILRMSLSLNLTQPSSAKLEGIVGSQMDRANLDNILVPAPIGGGVYDVGIVLRLCKSFLIQTGAGAGSSCSRRRLKIVGSLIDLYLAEVAPDPSLKPQKFVSLAMLLPDDARDSYDGVYRALDMYITVHVDLTEEQRLRICCVLNYEKLSTETCKHLAQNSLLPSRTAIQALLSQQSKLKNLLTVTTTTNNNNSNSRSSYSHGDGEEEEKEEDEQVILYAKKLEVSNMENEKLKAHLQGMQWKVLELEKICRKLQSQITRMMKTNTSSRNHSSSKSLPKLCS